MNINIRWKVLIHSVKTKGSAPETVLHNTSRLQSQPKIDGARIRAKENGALKM
jgi:hypothetical protein